MYYNITMLLKQTLVHGMHVIQVGMNALFVDGLRGVSLLILRVFVGGKVVLLLLRWGSIIVNYYTLLEWGGGEHFDLKEVAI